MNQVDLAIANLIEDFKNYPDLEAAWQSLSDRHEQIFKKWSDSVSDDLSQ